MNAFQSKSKNLSGIFLLIGLFLPAFSRAEEAIHFEADRMYALPGLVLSLAAEDFNRDGIPDIACVIDVPEDSIDGFAYLLGQPGGKLGEVQFDHHPFKLVTLETGDFNSDGAVDFAAVNFDGTRLLFYHNRMIAEATTIDMNRARAYDVSVQVKRLQVVDYDADGLLDVIGWSASSRRMVFLRNVGVAAWDGFSDFEVSVFSLPGSAATAEAFAAANFGGSARAETVLLENKQLDQSQYASNLAVYEGVEPDPQTDPPVVFAATASLTEPADQALTGLIDTDEIADLLAITHFQQRLEFFGGGVKSGFLSSAVRIDSATRLTIGRYLMDDLNGDGRIDILDPQPSLFLGEKEDFDFTPVDQPRIQGSLFAQADFDGDGKPDIAAALGTQPYLGIFPGKEPTAEATIQFGQTVAVEAGGLESRLTAMDLDHDGRSDLAIALFEGTSGDRIALFHSQPEAFESAGEFTLSGRIERLFSRAGVGDSSTELLVLQSSPAAVKIYHLEFGLIPDLVISLPIDDRPRDLFWGNIDQDSIPDLVIVHDGGLTLPAEPKITLWQGLQPGGFMKASERSIVFDVGLARPGSPQVADFNGDGYLDLAIANLSKTGDTDWWVLHGDGSLDLTTYDLQEYSLQLPDQDILDMAMDDIDQDGTRDLGFLMTNGVGYVTTIQQKGEEPASFSPLQYFPGTYERFTGSLAFGNLRLEDKPDLVSLGGEVMTIQPWLEGESDSTYSESVGYAHGGSDLAIGDFDGDSLPDIAGVDGRNFRIYLNRSVDTPTPTPTITPTPTPTPTATRSADFDGNNWVDHVDLFQLIKDRHVPTPQPVSDLDGSGKSNGDDLLLFQPQWQPEP